MEVRPNSHPELIGPFMTGTVVDSSVRGQRSADIAPDTTPECCIERLITRRTQRLKDDRQNLKDRLHRYINLRSIKKWNPQNTLTTFCLRIDLNHWQHSHTRRSCLHQSLWPKLASILRYYTHCFTQLLTLTLPLLSSFSYFHAFGTGA